LEDQSIDDPKIIKIYDILMTLMNKIALGMPDDSKKIFLGEKLEYIIQYGEKYNLLDRLNEEDIRLVCSGISTGVVLRNIKNKL
jgi:hypothetical protein